MEAYSDFAYVYDTFMDATPYEDWCEYIISIFEKYSVPKELVLDLGCGTGVLTRMLSDAGYDMIGVDNSWEMLQIAREAAYDDMDEEFDEDSLDIEDMSEEINDNGENEGETAPIMYLLQDMREFELYGTVRAVVSVCDSVNYLLKDDEIIQCFKLVNNYLDPKGIFIFDFNTEYKYREVIGDTTIAENREDCSFIWDNSYDCDTHINEYDLTIFALDEESGQYDKSVETHLQRGYTVEEMTSFISKSGMELLEVVDADTHGQVTDCSERVYIIARECGK